MKKIIKTAAKTMITILLMPALLAIGAIVGVGALIIVSLDIVAEMLEWLWKQ